MLDFGKKSGSGQSCFVSSTLCSFTWHCLLSPWSRPLSDTEQKIIKSWSNSRLGQFFNEDGKQHKPGHRQCNRRRAQHPPWCRPQCCTFSSLKLDESKIHKFWVEIISIFFYLSLASCLSSRAGMQGMMQPSSMKRTPDWKKMCKDEYLVNCNDSRLLLWFHIWT